MAMHELGVVGVDDAGLDAVAQALLGIVGPLLPGRGESCLEGQADARQPLGSVARAAQVRGEPLHGGQVERGHGRAAALDGEVGGDSGDDEGQAVRAVALEAGDEALQQPPELDRRWPARRSAPGGRGRRCRGRSGWGSVKMSSGTGRWRSASSPRPRRA